MTSALESPPSVEAADKPRPDLLRFGPLRRLVLSRFYPGLFQAIGLAVFAAIIGFGFFGPPMGDDNFAVALTWRLWWLALPFTFVLLGRVWCAVCPVGAGVDLVSPRLPWGRRSPGAFLKRHGVWLMAGLYLILFWAGMLWHVCCWPQATALWLLGFAGTALGLALVYERRVWCRYLCPVGAFGGLYSMMAPLQLRARQNDCRELCFPQRRGWVRQERQNCPFFELPMALASNQNCNLCGRCLKDCQLGALSWEPRPPAQETWQPHRSSWAQTGLVLLMATLALVEALQMTTLLPAYMKWGVEGGLGLEYDALFTLTLLVGGLIVTLLYVGANVLSGAEGSRFSLAYLPLVAGGYLGTMAFRLAMQAGRALEVTLSQLGLLAWEVPPPIRSSTYYVIPQLKAVQFLILGVGLALTVYALWRIGRDLSWRPLRILPHLLLTLFMGGIFGYLFWLPGAVILH